MFPHGLLLSLLLINAHFIIRSGSLTFMDDKKSYVMYEPWDASKEAMIRFRFRTHNPYGLLFYVDDGNKPVESGNFFQLMIDKGVLLMTMQISTKELPTVKHEVMLGNSLDDGEWHEVKVVRSNKITTLRVDGLQRIVHLPKGQVKLIINSNLFIGGTPRNYEQLIVNKFLRYTTREHKKVHDHHDHDYHHHHHDHDHHHHDHHHHHHRHHQHPHHNNRHYPIYGFRFVGCIDRLFYSKIMKDVPLAPRSGKMLATQEVRQGCVNACRYQGGSCPNGGRCVNLFNRVGCNCLGTGYEDVNCTRRSKSVTFKGFDYVTWKSIGPGEATANRVQLRFKTAVESGILVIIGSPYTKYILVELYEGNVLVHARLDNSPITVPISSYLKLSDREWHTVEVYRREDKLRVTLDLRYTKNGTIPTTNNGYGIPNEEVLIGGHFNPSLLEASKSKRHYIGCLQQVFCEGTNVINEAIHERSQRVKIRGNVEPGCALEPTEGPFVSRTTEESMGRNVWTEGRRHGRVNRVDNEYGQEISDLDSDKAKVNKAPVQSARRGRRKREMSQSTITGITAGTIVGAIAVIIAVACFINHLKKKYSGVFITSTMYTRGESFEHTPFNNGEAQLYLSSPTGRPVKGARV